MKRPRLTFVAGTRPEAIKLAPVLSAAEQSSFFDTKLVVTGQHRQMLDQVLALFGLTPDVDLSIMQTNQSLSKATVAALSGLSEAFQRLRPDCVIVQGDTLTTFAASLAAFYLKIPVAHVEAGLRTFDLTQPFPEEANRLLTSRLASFHFVPTQRALENLVRESIGPERIWITGNTVIDALLATMQRTGRHVDKTRCRSPGGAQTLLFTSHRRENQGETLAGICDALLDLLRRYDTLRVISPIHLSPNVQATVRGKLGQHPRVTLTDPLDYAAFILKMHDCDLILTDSGGVQEEAPTLGRPVLVLRETTERPEAEEAGVARVIGTKRDCIVTEVSRLLDDEVAYKRMAEPANPYGDGQAAQRIINVLAREFVVPEAEQLPVKWPVSCGIIPKDPDFDPVRLQ